MSFWQHETPLDCPKGHMMYWLGTAYWVCPTCHQVYVQTSPAFESNSR